MHGDPLIGRIEEYGDGTVTLLQYCKDGDKWSPVIIGDNFCNDTIPVDGLRDDFVPCQITNSSRLSGEIEKAFKLLRK